MVDQDLPVQVGQVAESRSFIQGYRGAWFRCKIKKIYWRKGEPHVSLEYLDFPDESVLVLKLYQKLPPSARVKNKNEKLLMMRPPYPPVYSKSKKPDVSDISEVTVIADGEWKVGDLVDWWKDNCYWSGQVTKVLNNDKLQIELVSPPMGEGLTYDVSGKDLRPSLDWSPEDGWSVPKIVDGKHTRHCAELINPAKEGNPIASCVDNEVQKDIAEGGIMNAMSSSETRSRNSSPLKILSEEAAEGSLRSKDSEENLEPSGSGVQKTGSSDTISRFDVQADEMKDAAISVEKMKNENTIRLNSMFNHTLEAAVLDLATLASRVREAQNILKSEVASQVIPLPLKKRKP